MSTTRVRQPGVSFCLITDGRRPALLLDEIVSIKALGLSAYEIIVVGNVPPLLGHDDVQVIMAPELARDGRLGAMRNTGCGAARFERLVVADDDMYFHPEFGAAVMQFPADADVVCVRLLNPDGTRFWDWATYGGPRGHVLLDYHETDDFVYVTGGLAVMKAAVHDLVPWDDARGFYQGEDVEWSARLYAAGARIRFHAAGAVTHRDARYTQDGYSLRFRQDLTMAERLAVGVEARGVFREGVPGLPGSRWMSETALLTAPPASPEQRMLRLSLSSLAPALADTPFQIAVTHNGAAVGHAKFHGTTTLTLTLPLRKDQPTEVVLTSDMSAPANQVGIDDERAVSVVIHNAKIELQ